MEFRENIKVNNFDGYELVPVGCTADLEENISSRRYSELHYNLVSPNGEIVAEYDCRFYQSGMYNFTEVGYNRCSKNETTKGGVTYGFNMLCRKLFENVKMENLFVCLRISDENPRSLNIARNLGFIRKGEDDIVYIKLNPRAREIIKERKNRRDITNETADLLIEFIEKIEAKTGKCNESKSNS